mmetsp:Transcript_41899/g.132104  ORF Transcript_41899/g.132104 Transcript_41899/m.132104 type:complete len:205 (-) Transcript_41899:437-1051(-)
MDPVLGPPVRVKVPVHPSGSLQELLQPDPQGPDEVHGRGSKVGRLPLLVALHDGHPAAEVRKVVGDRCLVGDALESLLGADHDAQAGRYPNGLLRARQDEVDAPLVHAQLLPSSGADGIHHDERVGGDAPGQFAEGLEIGKHARGRIDPCNGDDLVGAGRLLRSFQLLLHLLMQRPRTNNLGSDRRHFHPVLLVRVLEPRAEEP